MRFTYAEAMTDPSYYIPLAKAADEAGYHAMTIPDSIAYPFESDSTYPYTADGSREFLDGKSFIESFSLIGNKALALAVFLAVTSPVLTHVTARVAHGVRSE